MGSRDNISYEFEVACVDNAFLEHKENFTRFPTCNKEILVILHNKPRYTMLNDIFRKDVHSSCDC